MALTCTPITSRASCGLYGTTGTKKVTGNREIPLPKAIPVMSFGEDEKGELYFTTYSPEGQGVYRLLPAAPAVSKK